VEAYTCPVVVLKFAVEVAAVVLLKIILRQDEAVVKP